MLNLVREGEEDYIEAIRYRRRLKIFENFLLTLIFNYLQTTCLTRFFCGSSVFSYPGPVLFLTVL